MSQTVLLLGSGSREHALAWKVAQSPKVGRVIVAPGNGGTERAGGKISNLALNIKNNAEVTKWCGDNKPSLVVVGPEDPLDRGIADDLRAAGVACFGPGKEAAQIECSKAFAKEFMSRHQVPTARYQTFINSQEAKKFVRNANFEALVVKASGLAAGKGVIVAKNKEEACTHIDLILESKRFGEAGSVVIVEELLKGPEVSVLAFCDGTNVSVMPPAQDHKRAYDDDEGPNTGGMGAYCPCPFVKEATLQQITKDVIQKTVDGLRKEGKPFVGVLFAGIMLAEDGPKVLEFNCRFGDPETQSVLPLLESDLFDTLLACAKGKLSTATPKWKSNLFTCGVVIASGGYPETATKGQPIGGLEEVERSGLLVFHGGTEYKGNKFLTSGGRVLSVVALDGSLVVAADKAQRGAQMVKIEKAFHRKDIAKQAIERFNLRSLDYKSSGVDIVAGDNLVSNIKKFAKKTNRSGVLASIGGFGALFDLKEAGYEDPILVSGTDGVGTKLKVALEYKCFDSVGIDLVAMCVNDILVQGAEPLFFLDYFACGKLDVEQASQVISGIAKGCQLSNCALVGGETAEMPGMYSDDDFDLAGFSVGAVPRKGLLPRSRDIKEGDVIIGLPSSGVHSNGFSMVRKLMSLKGVDVHDKVPFDQNSTFGELLLTPTKIYVKSLLPVIKMGLITALAHITGGGLNENIPRILPKHLAVELDACKWEIPQIFEWIQREGHVQEEEMLKTFNCGIGMVCIVNEGDAEAVLKSLRLNGETNASIIGKVTKRTDRAVTTHNFTKSVTGACPLSRSQSKKRVAVLISGSGTNLQALIDHTKDKTSHSAANIVLVISNVPEVEGLRRAQNANIATKVINHKGFQSREEFDMVVHKALEEANVDIVCLAGFMRIISERFVKLWEGKMINIHPSLLPAFPGLKTHEAVLKAGVRVHGSTVHFVDSGLDSGSIILQEAVPVLLGDTADILEERVKRQAEHKIFPLALEYLARGQVVFDSNLKRSVWKLV